MVSHFRFLVGSSTRWIDHLRWENPRESSGGGGLVGPWVRWWSTIGYHRYNVYNHQVSAIPCSLWPIFESQSQLGPSQQLSIHIDTKLPTREDEQAVSMVMLAPWPGRLLDRHWLVVQCQCAHLEKWWTSSMGFGWHPIYEMENNPFMFETTKQYTFLWLSWRNTPIRDHMLGDHSHAIDAICAMIIPCHDNHGNHQRTGMVYSQTQPVGWSVFETTKKKGGTYPSHRSIGVVFRENQ